MNNSLLEQQLEFITSFNQNISNLLDPPDGTADLRLALIEEELEELKEAFEDLEVFYRRLDLYLEPELDHKMIVEQIFKEFGDLVYVVMGLATTFQIPLDDIMAEVHRSNMSKVHPNGEVKYREDGKVLKPETYSPAQLSEIVEDYFNDFSYSMVCFSFNLETND